MNREDVANQHFSNQMSISNNFTGSYTDRGDFVNNDITQNVRKQMLGKALGKQSSLINLQKCENLENYQVPHKQDKGNNFNTVYDEDMITEIIHRVQKHSNK